MDDDFHIQWHITNRCLLRCAHCYQDDFSPAADLPRAEVERIRCAIRTFLLEENRRLTINLTGGEPFLSPEWRTLLADLREDPLVDEVGLITSGLCFSRDVLTTLHSYKPVSVKISAEGFDRDAYERFRGAGTWNRFLRGLDAALDAGLSVTLMFTLLETNANQVAAMLRFAAQRGIQSCIVERFIPWGSGRTLAGSVVSRQTWLRVCAFLLDACGCPQEFGPILPYRAFLVRLTGRQLDLLGAPCIVARDGLALMPDGTVFPCRRFPIALGNLREERLGTIWHQSPILRDLRDRSCLKDPCGLCDVDGCIGCRALAYALTGDFRAADPLCFL